MVVLGNGSVSWYVNGILQGISAGMGTATPSNNLNIGYWYFISDASRYLGGSIDEVKIWNYARSAEQIGQDYIRGLKGLP